MKIQYEILWFEDQPDDVRPQIDAIKNYLEANGFGVGIDMQKSITVDEVDRLADRLAKYCRYDLIICDWDMGVSADGIAIARRLRSKVFTDIIFYSGKSVQELRTALYDNRIDGVYPIGSKSIAQGLKKYLADHIRRACGANTMRGIVLDEVGRFDRKIRDLCKVILQKQDDEYRAAFLGRLVKAVEKSNNQRLEDWRGLECPIPGLSKHRYSDFNMVRQRLAKLIKIVQCDGDELLGDGKALNTLQSIRNRLAHLDWELGEDGVMRLSDNPEEGFDYEMLRKLRAQVRQAGIDLEKIEADILRKLA